jgi:hypothetical protein
MELISVKDSVIQELRVVKLEGHGHGYMIFEWGSGVFGEVVCDCVGEVVLADKGLADDVGVGEGGGGVCEDAVEGEGFVGEDEEAWGGF